MLTLRARIFVIMSVIVLIILGISVGLLLARRQATKQNTTNTATTTPTNNTTDTNPVITIPIQTPVQNSVPTGLQVKPRTSVEATQSGVKQFAKMFVERYTTYSTDSNFQNIRDVQNLVTPELWKTLSAKIGVVPTNTPFSGVSTQVVMTTLVDWKDAAATIELKTQQLTTKSADKPVTSYTNYKVQMVKRGNDWLVDSVTKE